MADNSWIQIQSFCIDAESTPYFLHANADSRVSLEPLSANDQGFYWMIGEPATWSGRIQT